MTDEELHALHARNFPDWKPPTLIQKAGSAIHAAADAIARAVRGESLVVSQPEQMRRLAICRGCDRFQPKWERCGACECFVNLKTVLKSQHCPLRPPKW